MFANITARFILPKSCQVMPNPHCRPSLLLSHLLACRLTPQASLFRLYELTAIASAAVGEPQPQLVELLAALAAEVSPGSSEHLFWAQQFRWVG
jgi:hypothetical protein